MTPNKMPREGFFYSHRTSMMDSFSCIPFDFQTLILIIAGFSLSFVLQESLGLSCLVYESPRANFKSPIWYMLKIIYGAFFVASICVHLALTATFYRILQKAKNRHC